ncbi:hypothetical protein Emag_006354 [Eimeria magna]
MSPVLPVMLPLQVTNESVGGQSDETASLPSFSETGNQTLIACSAEEAAYSFSQWKKAMLRFCFGALNLYGKPHKIIKYSRMAAKARVGLGALGFVDCSAMRTFCSEGRPVLCRRSASTGATVPFAVDGFTDLHISALQMGFAPPHDLDDAENLDSSWLAFLTGAFVAALLLLVVFLQRSRLLVFVEARLVQKHAPLLVWGDALLLQQQALVLPRLSSLLQQGSRRLQQLPFLLQQPSVSLQHKFFFLLRLPLLLQQLVLLQ